MFDCPNCHIDLKKTEGNPGVYWSCPSCGGRSATVSLLRHLLPKYIVNEMWQTAWSGEYPRLRNCPSCGKSMEEVPIGEGDAKCNLDICTLCQTIWFDAGEYESLPKKMRELSFEDRISPEAREQLAIASVRQIRAEYDDRIEGSPDEWWQWVIGFFGVPVEGYAQQVNKRSWGTWGVAALVFIVSVICFGDLMTFATQFGFVPSQYDRLYGMTFVTPFFIHGDIFHLLSNLYFLVVFGDNVEEWMGVAKYLALLVVATIAGNLLHMAFNMDSTIPCIGASGGVSGILAFYALQFPRAKLNVMVFFRWLRLPAWTLFGLWLIIQFFGVHSQLAGVSNVSALAHIGGVLAGFAFWLTSKAGGECSFFRRTVDFTRDSGGGGYNKSEKG